jgi:hypothetical protein
MGSSDYLNSARRAAIAFLLLAVGAFTATGYRLAISARVGAPVEFGAGAKPQSEPQRPVAEPCAAPSSSRCANLRIADGFLELAQSSPR